MKQRLLIFLFVVICIAPSAFGLDGVRPSVLLRASSVRELREPAAVRNTLTRSLETELQRAGYEVVVDRQRRGRMESREFDYIVEVGDSDSTRTPLGGVGGGTRIGAVGVGTEVSVVRAEIAAEFRLYDGRTDELIDTFDLAADASAPALTGVGLGDRYGFFFINIPVYSRGPYREATRRLAREAVEVIAEASASDRTLR